MRSRWTRAASWIVSFTGLSSSIAPSFSFVMNTSSPAIRLEHEIVGNQHPHGKAWPDRDRRLHVQRTSDHLLSDLVEAFRRATADGLQQIIRISARANLLPGAEKLCQRG